MNIFGKKQDNGAGDSAQEKNMITMDKKMLSRLLLPLIVLLIALGIPFLPKTEMPETGAVLRTLSVPNYPLALVLEQRGGVVSSALLRTPAGTREIDQLRGLSFVSEGTFCAKVDQDEQEDLLWRSSFTNLEGDGVHLWIGMLSWPPKVFISTTPYRQTRWDAIPAKIIVPKGTALYVAPATPTYDSNDTLQGKDAYTFVYTIRMTPEGPAYVPVPDVYSQLAVILQAGMRGELTRAKRIVYLRMLSEFEKLADGEPPRADTLLNFQQNKIDTLAWEK
ncbi:hypothetical protein LJC40_01165 [Synergistaceae bacterium OttesenSCG-928-D05]|nr:hypothetical protein [Synergistaceae bacterium OttesenSCG-928-D05]